MENNLRSSLGRKQSMFVAMPMSFIHETRSKAGCSSLSFVDDPGSELVLTKKAKTKYQNTYRLEPTERFSTAKVEALMEQVLMDHLEDSEYSESSARRLVKIIADKILSAVKKMNYHRYKLVVIVNIGQMNRQTIRVASRCLWQTLHDNFAEASLEGRTIWSTAVMYGIYQE